MVQSISQSFETSLYTDSHFLRKCGITYSCMKPKTEERQAVNHPSSTVAYLGP